MLHGPVPGGLLVAWNGAHVAAFYAWLSVANHWEWRHTWLVTASLLVIAVLVRWTGPAQRSEVEPPVPG